jgi:hypothetical protein
VGSDSAEYRLPLPKHLSPDILRALETYQEDIARGAITFGPEGFADTYPGQVESNRSIGEWLNAHTPDY